MTILRPDSGWKINGTTTHPGQVLLHDFLLPLNITARALGLQTKMPATRVGEILRGRRSVTPDTALRLARLFGTSAEFWLNLQAAYDLSHARMEREVAIMQEVTPLPRSSAA